MINSFVFDKGIIMTKLSTIAESIRNYKLNAVGGYEEWSKVPCSENYRMYVPSKGFDVTGHEEVKEVIFGWLNDIEAKQELVNIIEFKNTVTTFLHISNKDGEVLDIVEVFKINTEGEVEEIWAL